MSTQSATMIITSFGVTVGDRVVLRHEHTSGCTTVAAGTEGRVEDVLESRSSGERFLWVNVGQNLPTLVLQPIDVKKPRNQQR